MNDFFFQCPTRFVFGRDVVDSVGAEVAKLGAKKVLLVYGQGSVVRTGTLARVQASLEGAGVVYVDFPGVRPNPEVQSVREGIVAVRRENVDLILPVGGGSAIDCAKAIAFGAPYDGDVWDIFDKKAQIGDCMPIAVVLTIPAAGSESSSSCVISNDELGLKRGVNGDVFRPALAIMDPELTLTLPPYQTGAGVTDMIAHICERYFSGQASVPVTDNIALGLICAIIDSAEYLLEDPDDYEARANIMWASTLAHNDLAGCGLNAVATGRAGGWESHGLEHELSAYDTSITHGAGLAVIMPAWMRYVWRENPGRFLSFGETVFGIEPIDDSNEAISDAVNAIIDELQDFFASMGMPRKLGEFGLTPDCIDSLLVTLEQNKGSVFGGFKKLTMEDARAIYLSAF